MPKVLVSIPQKLLDKLRELEVKGQYWSLYSRKRSEKIEYILREFFKKREEDQKSKITD